MALSIVRNDITKMEVDAIVNSTNENLLVGGYGVDASIHAAAGPELDAALKKIGSCPVGSAVITPSFGISSCRYIIHTAGPHYEDGQHGERELLESCYRSILAIAWKHGCRSLAIPSISTGAYRYPKAEAYSAATSCIRDFLLSLREDEDMTVYLVLFDRESVAVSEKIDTGVRQFIDDAYQHHHRHMLLSLYNRSNGDGQNLAFPSVEVSPSAGSPEKARAGVSDLYALPYHDVDLSFAEMCEWWCRKKRISKSMFYTRANINKALFWAIKHNPRQIPKKTIAIACAIALNLNYEETQDLLMRAGLTLSKYYELDLVVEYFIRRKNYNIYDINAVLFTRNLPPLGVF